MNQPEQQQRKYVGAGVILARIGRDRSIEYLLLRGAVSGVWSFSKGHPEAIDRGQPFRTAVRETAEETGFICGRDYQIIGDSIRYGKRPYWVGIMHPDAAEPRVAPLEHSEARWMTYDEIAALETTNTDVRMWIKKMQSGGSRFAQTISHVVNAATPPICLSAEACSAS